MDEQLAGTIERITYYNEGSGYSVVKILPDKRYPRAQARDGTVAVVGVMPELNEGESAEFTGEWVHRPQVRPPIPRPAGDSRPPEYGAGHHQLSIKRHRQRHRTDDG